MPHNIGHSNIYTYTYAYTYIHLFFFQIIRGFFADWLVEQNGIMRIMYVIKKQLFTGSNEACQRYSYNLDEGRNSIWMKTAIYSECIGLRISNCIH